MGLTESQTRLVNRIIDVCIGSTIGDIETSLFAAFRVIKERAIYAAWVLPHSIKDEEGEILLTFLTPYSFVIEKDGLLIDQTERLFYIVDGSDDRLSLKITPYADQRENLPVPPFTFKNRT